MFNWAQGLGIGPDVSHAVNVSACKTEGNGVGDFAEPPVGSKGFQLMRDALEFGVSGGVVRVSFRSIVGDGKVFLWEAVLVGRKLFVEVPDGIMFNNSKESFISMLEYAEQTLHCSHVIICMKKERLDRASLVRNFLFLGFTLLPSGHPHIPAASGSIVYLAYTLDDPGEEDSD